MNPVLLMVLLIVVIVVIALLVMAVTNSGQDTSSQINQTVENGLRRGDEASDAVRNDIHRTIRR